MVAAIHYVRHFVITRSMNEIAIRKRALQGGKLLGSFLNSGSAILAELAGRSGLDWALLDMEHGSGYWGMLTHQLIALEDSNTAPVIRLPSNQADYLKRALDLGAHGLMVPHVNTADEARAAVSYSRYPTHGNRGFALMNRRALHGAKFKERLESSHENTLIIAQIDSTAAIENVEEIAAVDGVDVLFVGPMDLSICMGILRQFDHPDYIAATEKVVEAAKKHNKASGVLGFASQDITKFYAKGFHFLAVGFDGGMVAIGMKELVKANQKAVQ